MPSSATMRETQWRKLLYIGPLEGFCVSCDCVWSRTLVTSSGLKIDDTIAHDIPPAPSSLARVMMRSDAQLVNAQIKATPHYTSYLCIDYERTSSKPTINLKEDPDGRVGGPTAAHQKACVQLYGVQPPPLALVVSCGATNAFAATISSGSSRLTQASGGCRGSCDNLCPKAHLTETSRGHRAVVHSPMFLG